MSLRTFPDTSAFLADLNPGSNPVSGSHLQRIIRTLVLDGTETAGSLGKLVRQIMQEDFVNPPVVGSALDRAMKGVIKSVQIGTITIGAAALTGDATITAVSTTRSIPFHLGQTPSANVGPHISSCYLTLFDATTVRASRAVQDGSTTLTVSYAVLEAA